MSISATSGVVSNIDYQTLISQLVGARRQSINQLNTEKSTLERANSVYSSLSTRVQDLKTAAEDLKTASSFKVFKSSVSDSAMMGATTTSTATTGKYDIKISALAKSHQIAADGVALDTSTIAAGPGSFSFQLGTGAVQTVSVDATTTLTGLKDSINALKAGVTATIANDGSGPNPYRLILKSDSTGTANSVAITQNDTSLAFSTTLQAAQDASLTVDGMTYTRSSNSVSDILTGVTLDLKSADNTKTFTLSVDRDTAEITNKITALTEKYNGILTHIKTNNRYDTDLKVAGALFGDSVARSINDDLRRTMTSAVSGLPDTMNRLLHAGVTSDSDGNFTVDSTKLTEALTNNFDAVVNLFADNTATGGIKGFGGLISDMANSIDDAVDGRIKSRQDGLNKNIDRIDEDVLNKETAISAYEEQLRSQFMGLETMLATIKSQSNFLMGL
ncbi:MAG: flagellar filament capping protein FliD [Deltaproteobacteria bacterium]|nr:flagellar filament capping protein FliD [Deltaproteobacteria bacterium]